MKFELDNRTGMMRPKKDEEIYFAQSQGGGLIVDDKKNNIKYVIQRDGRITKLFGSFDKDNLNFYDMRDARIIADRVRRLLGVDHKYTDFHYFLRGYHMNESVIRKCSDFLGESTWGNIVKRAEGELRKEEGILIGYLEDGTRLVIPSDSIEYGTPIEFDNGEKYYYIEEADAYISICEKDGVETYYTYDPDTENAANMVHCFEADELLRRDDFGMFRAMINEAGYLAYDFENLEVTYNVYGKFLEFVCGREEYVLFWSEDDARDYAFDSEKDLLESSLTKGNIKHFYNLFGDSIFKVSDMEDALKESYEIYYDDLEEEDAIDELLRLEIIEDNEDYFYVDEDGETDHSQPSFDYTDYKDQYVEKMMDDINDVVDEFFSNYGYDGVEDYIDLDKLTNEIIDSDCIGSIISSYDSQEREQTVDDTTYYIYRLS